MCIARCGTGMAQDAADGVIGSVLHCWCGV